MEIWVGKLVTRIQTGRVLLSCAYTTQLLHSTVEVCWNNNISYFIWIKLCAKSLDKYFQEVLEAVLVGAWSIPPTAHGWLLCGSPTRVSMMFILSVGKLLFELIRISNNV